jgi:hypothetical protein
MIKSNSTKKMRDFVLYFYDFACYNDFTVKTKAGYYSMKFSKILALLLILILSGCTQPQKQNITESIAIQFSNGETKDTVTSDFDLPTSIQDLEIVWTSDSPFAVIEQSNVIITRQTEDIHVTLTATVTINGKTFNKTFEFTIVKTNVDFNVLFNAIQLPNEVTGSITLPISVDGHSIQWKSSNESILSNTGVVNLPDFNRIVFLTATFTVDGITQSRTYSLTVIAPYVFDYAAFENHLNLPETTEVDLIFKSSYLGNPVTWQSSSPAVISNAGLITRQANDVVVTLTASVTIQSMTYSVTVDVKVIKLEVVTPDYVAILNQISLPTQTVSNLSLPTVVNGVQIEWTSNNNAISATGVVSRKNVDVTVTLTAIISENNAFTKNFNVVVLKAEGYPVSTETPIAEVRLKAQGAVVKVRGVITSLMTNGNFTIQDASGAIPVYMNNNTGLLVGTEYIIEGTLSAFNGLIQLSSPKIIQTFSTHNLVDGIDLTGYSLDFDDVILYEANVITYLELEVTSKTTPNNAIELYLKNSAGEQTFVRLDKRVNVSPYVFDTIQVGEIIDLYNVTVGQYAGKAQFLFTSRSSVISNPKNPDIISIYGAVNRNYTIGNVAPNFLEGITARNGYGDDFTSLLGVDIDGVNLNVPGDYQVIVYLNNYLNVVTTYTIFVRNPIEIGVYEGYYQSLNGLTGSAFTTALRQLITSRGTATGSTSQVQSVDRVGSSYYLIYDGMGPYGNREHTWPQSKLGTVKDDLHNLRASNSTTNSNRGNLPFVEDGKTYTGNQPYGKFSGGWYPGDEHIGDVARIILYISIRYNLNIDVVGNLQTFLQWHEMDPVNDFERTRNDRIFGIQNNRNPFIDHPELVDIYFGQGNQPIRVSLALLSTSIHMLTDGRRYQY